MLIIVLYAQKNTSIVQIDSDIDADIVSVAEKVKAAAWPKG